MTHPDVRSLLVLRQIRLLIFFLRFHFDWHDFNNWQVSKGLFLTGRLLRMPVSVACTWSLVHTNTCIKCTWHKDLHKSSSLLGFHLKPPTYLGIFVQNRCGVHRSRGLQVQSIYHRASRARKQQLSVISPRFEEGCLAGVVGYRAARDGLS